MPIVKHISIHTTPLSNIEYILNGEKNEEMKLATGINISANPQSAYEEFRRIFEFYAKDKFYKTDSVKNSGKEKIRLHHYIQSFAPEEKVTPEEAHKIGIEWAKRVFGENMQVIVSTHVDKNHIHNHFAVCPYSLDGKKWNDNMTTLNRARQISDEIALEHGLHIIEKPKHKNTMKYAEWLSKQNGNSWKERLCREIDKIILREDVQNISDLAECLREQGYEVREGKYLSIKVPKRKNAIRSFRLGDGYSVEDLEYRIENKEKEISLEALKKYSGIQRQYALCMRQMQIAVFYKKPNRVTYEDLRKSAELLTYLSKNKINSTEEFENRLNSAAENYQNCADEKKRLGAQIERIEKIVNDGKIYLSLCDKDFLSAEEKEVYKNVSYVERHGINDVSDISERSAKLKILKKEFEALDEKTEKLKAERDYIADIFGVYKRDIENDLYNEIVREAEEERQDEQSRQNENKKER